MPIRAYFAFYKALFPFIAAVGCIALALFGVVWGYALYCTLGLIFGFVGFASFRKNEYYFYHNIGLTKSHLISRMFLINALVGIPVYILISILFFILFGGFRIT